MLFVLYVSKHDDTNNIFRYNQIHIKLFVILRVAKNGQFSEVALDYFKYLLAFICPTECAFSLEREEERSQLVRETACEALPLLFVTWGR